MTGQSGRGACGELTAVQRAGLHTAAVHAEGHLPASLSNGDLQALAAAGLASPLTTRSRDDDAFSRAARFRITSAGRSRILQEPLPRVFVVPCSSAKASVPIAPAGEMYVGSYHRAARRAAQSQLGPGHHLVILSAKFGILRPEDHILRYDLRAGQHGTVAGPVLLRQAYHLALRAAEVTVFAGKAYAALARQVWPELTHPLSQARGIGDHLAFFAGLYACGPGDRPRSTSRPGARPTPTAERADASRGHRRVCVPRGRGRQLVP
ncbi:DUF6884 domain-containing protein [Streptomyces sp. NBC_01601]|uniref:DUF6884 domain-containing protein n=1 Tax=Streptomyces sp. NBC_01601 TaxID=2975892 RepID=UPI002E2B1FD7|nr:DUF6884 domain-containing protein [Streptomyces sp. NBC_01601]